MIARIAAPNASARRRLRALRAASVPVYSRTSLSLSVARKEESSRLLARSHSVLYVRLYSEEALGRC